jgi:sarcosine oxidase subunit alpha
MASWLEPPRNPVALTLDGERIVAERGQPVAAALVAAGKLTLARSPKFHRPRGPACMRGACDGCLARVDGVPNVMTCLLPATEGLVISSQNTLGSREMDLLRMTDWFFPDGMNHHELFAGVPGVQSAMQLFARRVAGLGRLPDEARPPSRARRREVDVLVIGAGAAGMAMAVSAAVRGHDVEVVDDALTPGGGTRGVRRDDDAGLRAIRDAFDRAVADGRVVLRTRTVAAAFFGRELLVVGGGDARGAEVITAAAFVVAAGAHDGVVPFENNDFPGVMSARAACLLGAAGVSLGKRVVLLPATGGAREGEIVFGDVFERGNGAQASAGAATKVTRVKEVVRAKGGLHVRAVVVREDGRERSVPADALLVDAPRAPAYELCEQAGGVLEHRASDEVSGYVPVLDRGKVVDGVWAIGEVTGARLVVARFVEAADEITAQLSPPRARRTA